MSRRLSSPLELLYGAPRNVPRVGANLGPWGGARNAVSQFGGGVPMPGGGGCAPNPCGGTQRMASRKDRVRYLQGAALVGQVPSIFLGVRAEEDPTAAGAEYICSPQSSVPLLITRFEFEDDIATFLDVSSFKITRLDMIAGSNAVAGTTFNSKSTAPPIEDPILPAGVPMTIRGTNNSANPVTVRGTLRAIDLTDWMSWLDTGVS